MLVSLGRRPPLGRVQLQKSFEEVDERSSRGLGRVLSGQLAVEDEEVVETCQVDEDGGLGDVFVFGLCGKYLHELFTGLETVA